MMTNGAKRFRSMPKCVDELLVENYISNFQCKKKVEVVTILGEPCR
jgi:hypothetical protein